MYTPKSQSRAGDIPCGYNESSGNARKAAGRVHRLHCSCPIKTGDRAAVTSGGERFF